MSSDEASKHGEDIDHSVTTEEIQETAVSGSQSGGEEPIITDSHEEVNDDPEAATMARHPKAKPKRSCGRRSRKRRKIPESRQSNASEEIKPTDEAEIEVTASEKDKETKEEEEEEKKEPSPIVTRRSNRKLKQKEVIDTEEENQMEIENVKEEEEEDQEGQAQPNQPAPLDLDQDEVESVASELESIASSSTLTTRSRRPKGTTQDPRPRRQRGKVVKKSNANGNVKGKSRRAIFKKSSTRAPSAVAKAVTSDRVYYRGQYFTKGDIVSVEDMDSGDVYYAQLRGFLTDQYCEKSGVITWLLPTTNSPKPEDAFDPSTYVIGPEEDLPRKLEYFTFVMHAPDDYFHYKKAPYPTIAINADQEYLVARQGPKVSSSIDLLKLSEIPVQIAIAGTSDQRGPKRLPRLGSSNDSNIRCLLIFICHFIINY